MNDDIGFSMETVFSGTPEHRKMLYEVFVGGINLDTASVVPPGRK